VIPTIPTIRAIRDASTISPLREGFGSWYPPHLCPLRKENAVSRTRQTGFLCLAVLTAVVFGGRSAQAAGPFVYHSLTPCRVIDTRDGSGASNESAGARTNPGPHTFRMQGFCGIPVGADAVTLNVTVVSPSTGGDLRLFPSDVGQPTVSVMNYNSGEPALANGAILPLAQVGGNDISMVIGMACGGNGCGSLHVLMDVTGYFDTN